MHKQWERIRDENTWIVWIWTKFSPPNTHTQTHTHKQTTMHVHITYIYTHIISPHIYQITKKKWKREDKCREEKRDIERQTKRGEMYWLSERKCSSLPLSIVLFLTISLSLSFSLTISLTLCIYVCARVGEREREKEREREREGERQDIIHSFGGVKNTLIISSVEGWDSIPKSGVLCMRQSRIWWCGYIYQFLRSDE